ncbi:MAG: primosomal protein N', partial [Pseudomonadota bacterium]
MSDFRPGVLVSVLTTEPLDRFLDYKAPEAGLSVGDFVTVPLGPRRVLGVIWGPGEGGFDPARIRTVLEVLDVPPMSPELRDFLTRAAEYTLTPLNQMLRLATRAPGLGAPPGVRHVLRATGREPDRLTDARARVLEVLEGDPDGRYAAGELAALAGVSASVLKGLEAQGVLIRIPEP